MYNSSSSNDWRSVLTQDSRHRIVQRILDTMQRHASGRNDLYSIAARIEEVTYSEANSQYEYLKKISLKLLNLETQKLDEPLETYLVSGVIDMQIWKSDHEMCADPSPRSIQSEGEMQVTVWRKMQALKVAYLNDLEELSNLLALRCQQPMPLEQLKKLSDFKTFLQRTIAYMCAPKEYLPKRLTMDKMEALERQLINIMETFKRRKQPAEHQIVPPAIGSQNLEAKLPSDTDLENWLANPEINEYQDTKCS